MVCALAKIASCRAVYLHCVMGFNRSAAVAVLTVERLFGISRREAGEYVAARRRVDPAKHLALYDVESLTAIPCPRAFPWRRHPKDE